MLYFDNSVMFTTIGKFSNNCFTDIKFAQNRKEIERLSKNRTILTFDNPDLFSILCKFLLCVKKLLQNLAIVLNITELTKYIHHVYFL